MLIHNINPTAVKNSKNPWIKWIQKAHESNGLGRSSLSYGILSFTEMSKRCWQSALLRTFQVKYLSNDSSNQYGSKVILDQFCELFPLVTLLILKVKLKISQEFSSSLKCLCLRYPYWCMNKSRKFSKCPQRWFWSLCYKLHLYQFWNLYHIWRNTNN